MVKVQVDRYHEIVVAVVGSGNGYFSAVCLSEKFTDQIVPAQVG